MSQEDKKKLSERIREHIKKHKTIYLCGATGLVCIVGTRYVYRSGVEDLANQIIEKMPTPAVINNTVAPVITNNIENNLGPMRKIIRCVETGQLWRTMTEAAEAQGKSLALMSNHIHDRGVDTINGLHFVVDGIAA